MGRIKSQKKIKTIVLFLDFPDVQFKRMFSGIWFVTAY